MRSLAENVEKFWSQLLLDWGGATPTYITVRLPCCNHPLPLLHPPTVSFAPPHPLSSRQTQLRARGASGKLCGSFFRKCTTKNNDFFVEKEVISQPKKMERKDFLEKKMVWTEQFPVCWDAALELSTLVAVANVLFLPPMWKWNMCQLLTNVVTSSDWQCYTKKLNCRSLRQTLFLLKLKEMSGSFSILIRFFP